MRIIISPAKKMITDTDSLDVQEMPRFLQEAQQLLAALWAMPPQALQKLWGVNDKLAALTLRRLEEMELSRNLTPAILAYEGIQYQYMAPGALLDSELAYLQRHLRVVSGFYGLLRPFDGVVPYRLEMQARLAVGGHKDLYDFWGDKLARQLAEETDLVVNLASQEYSRAITRQLPPGVGVLTCTFGQLAGGRVVEKGTLCKMARGEMVRYLAQRQITRREEIQGFDRLGYTYSKEHSTEENHVFIKGDDNHVEGW